MKVESITTYPVRSGGHQGGMGGEKIWLFVKIETDEDVHGWGEVYTQLDRNMNIEQMVKEISRYLIGRDPHNIKHFTKMVYNDFAGRRGSMDLYSALSGLEQALWDIIGKKHGIPVYNMLGGAYRSKIRVYANGWCLGAKTPEEYSEAAVETVKRGFGALKFDPFPGPWRSYIDKDQEQIAIQIVEAVREAVGPDIDILIEAHRRLAPMHAIRVAKAIESFKPFWYEEPVPSENLQALAEVRERISIPVVTGEALYTKHDFRRVLEKRAADIINPDVCNCGGILELKEIAAMAEPYYVAVSPHNYNSVSVGLASTIQVSACISNFIITEYFVNFEETSNKIIDRPFKIKDGCISLPESPGIGIDLKEKELIARAAQQQSLRKFRKFEDETP